MTDRPSKSWHATIRGLRLSCWVAENEHGQPVEVRVICGGPLANTLADFCESLTIGLARGVPVGVYARTLRGRRDESGGPVEGDCHVTECGSIADYLARALIKRYAPEEEAREEAG